ncbi:f420-dependent nadp reductase [Colletotrichum kahawae]|uniref:F420-dependent nadp reductase n=1 Tax=Colletotrichum kahawae TaxID=34407 RepID=A0AAD9YI03_COLKA|nr:f420-dependent nadp reductase [Colletotrichum kahawae]
MSEDKQTVVIAGSGDLAQYLAEEFKVDNTHDVLLISRKEREFFTKLGVTTHEVDNYSTESVLAVLERANATVLISTLHTDDPTLYTSLHKALLLACKASKTCKRFIPSEFLGNLRRFDNIPRGIARARRAFRSELLDESEINWTLVNLGWLADYFVQKPDGSRSYIRPFPQGWPINMEERTVRVIGTGDEPICWTAARDVAKAVVKLVSHEEWPDHVYVFGEIGSWNQAIEKVERYHQVKLTVSLSHLLQEYRLTWYAANTRYRRRHISRLG